VVKPAQHTASTRKLRRVRVWTGPLEAESRTLDRRGAVSECSPTDPTRIAEPLNRIGLSNV
jgi:hypothetical protein